MGGKSLGEEVVQQILSLHEAGNSRLQIQVKTGVSQPTIRKILRENGYEIKDMGEPTRVTKELREQVLDLRNKGMTYEAIAKRVGLAKRTVMNIIKDKAVEVQGLGRSVSPELFIRTWQENDTLADVAIALGLTVSSVVLRAYKYRQKGVPLKRYTSRGYNWDELKEFAELFNDASDDDE